MKIKLRKEKYTITYRTGDIGSSMACECRSDDEARKLAREFLNCCDVVTSPGTMPGTMRTYR